MKKRKRVVISEKKVNGKWVPKTVLKLTPKELLKLNLMLDEV